MTGKEELERIFGIFHDGSLNGINPDGTDLILKVHITYLAERIQPEFHFFMLRLRNVKRFEFLPWSDVITSINDVQQIEALQLELNNSHLENNQIQIGCIAFEDEFTGGELWVDAESYELRSEAGTVMNVEELAVISKDYWTRFAAGE